MLLILNYSEIVRTLQFDIIIYNGWTSYVTICVNFTLQMTFSLDLINRTTSRFLPYFLYSCERG